MIVAFDGLDGVGKTTIARKFANDFTFKYIERPLYEVFGITNRNSPKYQAACDLEERVYNDTKSSELRACLTSLGLIYLHKIMNKENIVLDRSLLSNFSYNGDYQSLPLFKALLEMNIYPDVAFLLYASDDIRKQRVVKRNPNDRDLTNPDVISQTYDKLFKFINEYNLPIILINTDNKNEQEVYDEVRKVYENILKENKSCISKQKIKL